MMARLNPVRMAVKVGIAQLGKAERMRNSMGCKGKGKKGKDGKRKR